jgi:S-DNA-T family DNA segregation ATPase FtsK/SpoIIIE
MSITDSRERISFFDTPILPDIASAGALVNIATPQAIRNGSVATSFLQRKLKIGYGKAAQYIDIMEDQGIVGEKNGAKAREVLMTMQEWRELLSRRLDD